MATQAPNDTYNIGVRKTLNDMGIGNERIGYSNGYVTVDGSNVIKPSYTQNGTSYTDQSGYNTLSNYVKSLNSGAGTTTTQPVQQPQQGYYGYNNPLDTQVNSALQSYIGALQNPVMVTREQAYASPEYAAQQAQAQRATQQGIRTAQEAAGASGFGRSTRLTDRAQNIQNEANQYLETQVLPQIIGQLQAQENQKVQNLANVLNALTGQQSLYDTRFNNASQLAIQEGQLTGSYMNPQLRDIYNQLVNLKAETERNWRTMTPEQRAQAQATGDMYRSLLAAGNIDTSLIGADVRSSDAARNIGNAGVQTLAAQNQAFNQGLAREQMDFTKAQQEWENMFNQAQFDEEKAARIWEQAFKEKSFAQSVKDEAAARGLQWASLNQRQKEFIADQTFREKQFQLDLDKFNASQNQSVSYENNPNYGLEVAQLEQDPQASYNDYVANPQEYIATYGNDGYQRLLDRARQLLGY